MLLLVETGLVILGIGVAFACPRLGERYLVPLERILARVARRRPLSVFLVGASALILRAVLLPILPTPKPAVHDEFSYLLAGDTFAHGRVANPTHPMWVHFETFHVNQKPAYVSMYYPAQGLFLALGQVVFGHPFWGVWLSTGLMCAAICWMLQGWVPPFWALLGGVLAVIRIGTFSYWMNSYWGGSVAALGGALVLGAMPRIKERPTVLHSLLMGFGFMLLANSRPYEGLVFTVAVAIILLIRKGFIRWSRTELARTVAILLALFLLTLGSMTYYFWRTTGHPFRTPYAVNTDTYRPVPFFPWQSVSPAPDYQHAAIKTYYLGWAMNQYELARHHPVITLLFKAFKFWFFFLGPVLTLPLFAACFVLPFGISFSDLSRRTQALLLICGALFFAAALPVCFEPHYIAPVTCAFYALILIAMQRVRHWRPGDRPAGIALVRAVPLVTMLMFVLRLFTPTDATAKLATWHSPVVIQTHRAALLAQLENMPGPQLVIVRYDAVHIPADEWVYNHAEIDRSKVVWARDMGSKANAELIKYFKNREVWLVNPDEPQPKLTPYVQNKDYASSLQISLRHANVRR